MQYFILMIDYGKNYPGKKGPSGFEAVVHPENTRRQIIEQARDALKRDKLVHVKFVDGNFIEDVTAEIIDAAQMEVA